MEFAEQVLGKTVGIITAHRGLITLLCVVIFLVCVKKMKMSGIWNDYKYAFIESVIDKVPLFIGIGAGIVTALTLNVIP